MNHSDTSFSQDAEDIEAKYQHLLETAYDSILVVDSNGLIEFCNQRTLEIFGYKLNELLGQPVEILVPEPFKKSHGQQSHHYIEKPTPRFMGVRKDLLARRKDGSVFSVDIALTPLKTERGTVVTAFIRDMTEYKSEAIKLREDVLAIVSHDLKNPLSSIRLQTHLLTRMLEGAGQNEKIQNALAIINRATRQMDRLINDLLDFAKIESGSLSIDYKTADIASMLEDCLKYTSYHAQSKSIHIDLNVDQNLPVWECDPDRIVQVLVNLLSNAIKYSEVGSHVTLKVSVSPDGTSLIFSVIDHGPGISPENLSHVFDRYWQAKKTAKLGTGLGLFISKGIVQGHGGKIWAKSQLNKGSTFTFTLPVKNPATGPTQSTDPQRDLTA